MILNVSGRTDIVAFYTKWFMNRYNEGFVDVRNPFYPKNISRIYFKDVDGIYDSDDYDRFRRLLKFSEIDPDLSLAGYYIKATY